MHTYQITDTGSNFRHTVIVQADCRDAAQEQHIDQMESVGAACGTLTIRRVEA